MNSRRSFLRMLGLGAVIAPVVAKAVQAEISAPIVGAPVRIRRPAAFNVSSGAHTHNFTTYDPGHTHSFTEASSWEGEQWTPEQIARMTRRA